MDRMNIGAQVEVPRGPIPTANFALYGIDRCSDGCRSRSFMVVSTSRMPGQQVDRPVLDDRFTAVKMDALARSIFDAAAEGPVSITLRVHGFNTRRLGFEKDVL